MMAAGLFSLVILGLVVPRKLFFSTVLLPARIKAFVQSTGMSGPGQLKLIQNYGSPHHTKNIGRIT